MSTISNIAENLAERLPGGSNGGDEDFTLPLSSGEETTTEVQPYRQLQKNDNICEKEREQTILTFSFHTNICYLMTQNKISFEQFCLYPERSLFIKLEKNQFNVSNFFCYKHFSGTRYYIEKFVLNEMRGNSGIMDLISITIGGNKIATVISEAIINSIKQRYYNEQCTETDKQKGKKIQLKLFM